MNDGRPAAGTHPHGGAGTGPAGPAGRSRPAPSGTHSGCGGTVTGGSCDGCGADSIPPGNVEAAP